MAKQAIQVVQSALNLLAQPQNDTQAKTWWSSRARTGSNANSQPFDPLFSQMVTLRSGTSYNEGPSARNAGNGQPHTDPLINLITPQSTPFATPGASPEIAPTITLLEGGPPPEPPMQIDQTQAAPHNPPPPSAADLEAIIFRAVQSKREQFENMAAA